MSRPKLSTNERERRSLIVYALPALALAMPTLPLYLYLPKFYADELGLGVALTGLMLMLARLSDVVTDPLIGHLSDRLTTRWGRRKPWIALGAPIAAVGMLALVYPPAGVNGPYLLMASLVLYLGWTAVYVPYIAWGAEITRQYDRRLKFTSTREAAMLVGMLLAGAIPAIVALLAPDTNNDGNLNQNILQWIGLVAIFFGLPTIATLLWRLPDNAPPATATDSGHKITFNRATLASLVKNKPFVRLLAAWFINGLANGLPAVTFLFFMEYRLKLDNSQSNMLIFAYFAAAVLFMPLWPWLVRHVDKHRLWATAMGIAIIAFATVPFIGPGGWLPFMLVCVVTGAMLGADLALPPAMQADVMDYDQWKNGQSRGGLLFSLWSMATKLSLALAVGLGLPALGWMGFSAMPDQATTPNPAIPDPAFGGQEQETWGLLVIYCLAPIVLKGVAVLLVWPHPITRRRHRAILRRFNKKARI